MSFKTAFQALKEKAKEVPAPSSFPVPELGSSSTIKVSPRQKGNAILKYIHHVPYEFMDIVPDYVLGRTTCCLFISLRYHLLHPNYLFKRMRSLRSDFTLRLVLCHVDLQDCEKALEDVMALALRCQFTILCAWSHEEAARYLESLKVYESKPAKSIQERQSTDFAQTASSVLTSIRSVNKTDVRTLLASFDSVASIMKGSIEDLSLCPGFGEKKIRRVFDVFNTPLHN